MEFKIHSREKAYLTIMIVCSFLFYLFITLYALGKQSPLFLIQLALGLFVFNLFCQLFFIGYVRGNAIKIHKNQFPEVYEILKNQSEKLGLKNIPTMYLLQGNGILNAFATRFKGHNYIIIYSDVLAAAFQEGLPAVEFIIGHELGHLKRNHVGLLKSVLLLPARLIPFLSDAYSRACEYTCDNIGYNLCPEGAEKGLLILAAGKDLQNKINVKELLWNAQIDEGFATWLSEVFSTHPHLVKRMAVLNQLRKNDKAILSPFVIDNKSTTASLDNRAN